MFGLGRIRLYVSKGYEPLTAYKKDFNMHAFNFLTCDPWQGLSSVRVTFKIRHTPEFHKATLCRTSADSFAIHSDDLIQGVAPGQFCTVYDEEHHKCFGSGEIFLG